VFGQARTTEAVEDDPGASEQDKERIWSTFVKIDPGFPFDVAWPGVKNSVFRALRSVHTTWPEMGWRSEADLETSLRRAVEADGAGAVARGLRRAQAERVAQQLNTQLPCQVRLDRDGAVAAAMTQDGAGHPDSPEDDRDRREKLRQRIQELREKADDLVQDRSFGGISILGHIERDLEDDERWHSRASAMEHALDLMEGMTLRRDPLELFGGSLRPVGGRKITISVDRAQLLSSALGPVLAAAPEDLRPRRLCVKYKGEDGEDGEGGGGITRAFLTHVGALLADVQLGILLPTIGGHCQLNPLLGFLTPQGVNPESVLRQPERWSRFLGRLLGMAVVHECPLGLLLVPSLCKQLVGREPDFDDLRFVPGLNDGAAGWYSSLRALLVHRAPSLVAEDPTLVHLDADTVENALRGLEAVMPSRARQTFESLVVYVGSAVGSPQLWESAADVALCLLHKAKTKSQRDLALGKTAVLLKGIAARIEDKDKHTKLSAKSVESWVIPTAVAGTARGHPVSVSAEGRELLPDLRRVLRALGVELRGLRAAGADVGEVEELLRRAAAGERRGEILEAAQSPFEKDVEGPHGAASGGGQLPQSLPSLEREVSDVEGPGIAGGEELSVSNLQAFAEAVIKKALVKNLEPQLTTIVEEFGRVVPQRVRQGLSWQQIQDRISGRRLDPEAFVQAWRAKTTYQACTEADPSVKLWWGFVSERSADDLPQLFAWCTGFAAIPVTAWKFQIRIVDDNGRCPTVNTCMTDDPSAANHGIKMPTLYLPTYDSKATLARKMEWAIAGASALNLH